MTDLELQEDTCPMCGGPGVALGTLGYILHLRCRDCGADFSVDSPDSYEERD
jgi:rRNA maturation protein Nop10